MHYDNGTMSEMDYKTYTGLFEAMVMTPYFPHPDLLIYLEGTLDDVLGRIKTRGREMEKNTPISYWKEMYARYDDRSEEHTSELQSRGHLVCRLLLEKK